MGRMPLKIALGTLIVASSIGGGVGLGLTNPPTKDKVIQGAQQYAQISDGTQLNNLNNFFYVKDKVERLNDALDDETLTREEVATINTTLRHHNNIGGPRPIHESDTFFNEFVTQVNKAKTQIDYSRNRLQETKDSLEKLAQNPQIDEDDKLKLKDAHESIHNIIASKSLGISNGIGQELAATTGTYLKFLNKNHNGKYFESLVAATMDDKNHTYSNSILGAALGMVFGLTIVGLASSLYRDRPFTSVAEPKTST